MLAEALLAASCAAGPVGPPSYAQAVGVSIAIPDGPKKSACATTSRTFDGATQDFTNANGSHAALEAAVGQDVAYLIWVRPTLAGFGTVLYNGGDSTARVGFTVTLSATGVVALRGADAATAIQTVSGVGAMAANTWGNILAICDRDGDAQGYISGGAGMDATPDACPDGTFANTQALNIGKWYTSANYYAGRVGVTAVWIGADLSGLVTAKTALYNSGVPLSCAVLQATYGATACWEMDGAAGSNEPDEIGSVDLTQVAGPGTADGPGCN